LLQDKYLADLLSASKSVENARVHMYWPGIDGDIEDFCKRCQQCIIKSRLPKEPLKQYTVPPGPWKRLGMDVFELRGKKYLLIADYFSKYPFVYPIHSSSFRTVFNILHELFASEGVPDEIVSDNGAPFQSREFAEYMAKKAIIHITSSPHYARSNGFAERMIQTVKKLMAKAMETGDSTFSALAAYRSTPLANDIPSPSEILHGRDIVTGKVTHIDVKAI